MYDTLDVSMTVVEFMDLTPGKRNKAAMSVLDKPMHVTMYIANKPENQYTQFIIKTCTFCDPM